MKREHRRDGKSGQRTNECLPYFSPTLTSIIRPSVCIPLQRLHRGRKHSRIFTAAALAHLLLCCPRGDVNAA